MICTDKRRLCGHCRYWQDISDRVAARLSQGRWSRANVELRRCHWSPPPNVDWQGPVYTDEEFVCDCWEEAEKRDGAL